MADRRERFANSAKILVGKNCQNKRRALITELFPPGLGQDMGSAWVMSAIDDRAFVPALKAGRQRTVARP